MNTCIIYVTLFHLPELLTRHNREIAQLSPDPFPCERVGSGYETNVYGSTCIFYVMPQGHDVNAL